MKRLSVAVMLLLAGVLWAQEGINEYEYVATDGDADSVYSTSDYDQYIRDAVAGSDLDQDGKPEIIVTDYLRGNRIHVFEVTGDNQIEEVWVYEAPDIGYSSSFRSVKTGDLDGDGLGEIIAAKTGGSGVTNPDSVGLWIFEWDGQTDNGYVLAAQITEFAEDSIDRFRAEDIAVGDFDGDGQQEVLWVNNASTAFDNAYIFSITGDYPGFYTAVTEAVFRRTELGLGGSTVSGFGPVDMDGDGNKEVIIGVWNYVGFVVVEATGPDTYEAKYIVQGLDPDDRYPYGKSMAAYDLDGDGDDEFIYGALFRNRMYILNAGADVDDITVDTVEVDSMITIYSLEAGDPDHGVLSDEADIVIGSYPRTIYDIEGDTTYIAYEETDTLFFVGPAAAMAGDLDGDSRKEMVFCFFAATDSALPGFSSGFIRVLEYSGPVGVEEWTINPQNRPVLYPNRPNPFTGLTQITFRLPEPMKVSLAVYDIRGRRVAKLVDGVLEAGEHTVQWNGQSDNGTTVPAGTYFYRLTTPAGTYTRTMIVVR